MNNVIKITAYTMRDQLRHKSFYVLLGLSILFILMIRGCYDGGYTVNGEMVNNATVAWHVSKIVFHLIAAGMFLMVSMLSMKIFSRDHEDGSVVLFLSRSVSRWQYVLGRVTGTWVLCLVFMFILHLTIFLTVWAKTGAFISGYLSASLICSINLLFVIACVCFLSLYLPDFISALFTMGILFVGFISDGGYQILNSDIVRSAVSSTINADPALWRVLYPKVFMVQSYADTILGKSEFHNMGPLHPLLNLFFYILLIMTLLLVCFNKKEI
ncbi:MAG: ABC transporter permease subunit [Proteobacteria bacterium]|nr:ABC transporter permease subunit [Pseudomonadota bacterium]MBU4037308.1 ABC transporter permease subunit [Pseudomonadota bacterium]